MKGRELKKWRAEQFLSQGELAAILGCTLHTVANWERGRSRMPGSAELALEAISQQRATLVRKLRAAKESRNHQRRLKMIEQGLLDPRHFEPEPA